MLLRLCNGPKACGIVGATMFTYTLFWPLYLVLSLWGMIGRGKISMYLGSAMATLSTIWVYDLTVNAGRSDLFWIPTGHLAFAGLMLLLGLRNR